MNTLELSGRLGRVGLRARVVILVLLAVAPLFGLLVFGAIADRDVRSRTHELSRPCVGQERSLTITRIRHRDGYPHAWMNEPPNFVEMRVIAC